MLEIKGFQGYQFVASQANPLDAVITPPYDVITPDQREALAQQSPYSLVHLTLPQADGKVDAYTVAGQKLTDWIQRGVLRQDSEESLYVLEQVFEDIRGIQRVRRGFFALARLPEPGERTVLGHEHTFNKVVGDRLDLYRATKANLEPVFALYLDTDNFLGPFLTLMRGTPPCLETSTLDGVTQRLWRVPMDSTVADFFRGTRLYIADGHHRFRTACEYRDEMRAKDNSQDLQPYDYVLMGFVSMSDPGLLVYPTHRLLAMPADFDEAKFVEAMAPWFQCQVSEDIVEDVENAQGCTIGVAIQGGKNYTLTLNERLRADLVGGDLAPSLLALDVEVLHRGIFEHILGLSPEEPLAYERDGAQAQAAVESGQYGLAFLLKAPTPEQIQACAEANQAMPHKSTYFFPKLPSGTVIYCHC